MKHWEVQYHCQGHTNRFVELDLNPGSLRPVPIWKTDAYTELLHAEIWWIPVLWWLEASDWSANKLLTSDAQGSVAAASPAGAHPVLTTATSYYHCVAGGLRYGEEVIYVRSQRWEVVELTPEVCWAAKPVLCSLRDTVSPVLVFTAWCAHRFSF